MMQAVDLVNFDFHDSRLIPLSQFEALVKYLALVTATFDSSALDTRSRYFSIPVCELLVIF